MVKKIMLLWGVSLAIAEEPSAMLQKNCLACHAQQKIPSELIYRRYLIKYSTHDKIKERLFTYLQAPSVQESIMPAQFFLKFPMKQNLDLNQTLLLESIEEYLEYFDVKKKLVLP